MMSAIESAPRQLVAEADHAELSRLVTEHAWRTDHGKADTLHELYVDDGVLDVGTPLRGRDAIREWGRQIVAAPPWRTIRHACANMRFVADGPEAAHGTSILLVFIAGGGAATTLPFSVGDDHDRFVRTAEGWRFASRRWVELFGRGDELNLPR